MEILARTEFYDKYSLITYFQCTFMFQIEEQIVCSLVRTVLHLIENGKSKFHKQNATQDIKVNFTNIRNDLKFIWMMEKIQGIFGEIRYEDRGGLAGISYMDLTLHRHSRVQP